MGFSFTPLVLDLEGQRYQIDTGSELVAEAIVTLVGKLQNLGDSKEEKTKKMQALAEAQAQFLDSVLGEGAFQKIFEGRLVSYDDLEECTCYILNQITEYKKTRLSQYQK